MKNKKLKNNLFLIIFVVITGIWLISLTIFTVWAWDMHIWQAKVDNEAIYQLSVENAKQQVIIDELQK